MSDQGIGPAWWAVQCKPRQEARAQANLESSGVRTFLPLARYPGNARVEPLFPRYLFARCDTPGMAHRIRFARGVSKILGVGAQPTTVDDSVIEAIRSRTGSDGCVPLTPSWAPGDPVRITSGPLKDFVGMFEGTISGSDRVRLLLSVLHGQCRVVIDRQLIERRD